MSMYAAVQAYIFLTVTMVRKLVHKALFAFHEFKWQMLWDLKESMESFKSLFPSRKLA